MILIIRNDKDINLINNQKFIELKNICEVKKLKEEPYTILLINVTVDENGICENLNFFLEELIISIDVVAIITTKSSSKLREICEFHKISLLEI